MNIYLNDHQSLLLLVPRVLVSTLISKRNIINSISILVYCVVGRGVEQGHASLIIRLVTPVCERFQNPCCFLRNEKVIFCHK